MALWYLVASVEGVVNLGALRTLLLEYLADRVKGIVEGFSRMEAVEELCRKCGYRKRFGKTSPVIKS